MEFNVKEMGESKIRPHKGYRQQDKILKASQGKGSGSYYKKKLPGDCINVIEKIVCCSGKLKGFSDILVEKY